MAYRHMIGGGGVASRFVIASRQINIALKLLPPTSTNLLSLLRACLLGLHKLRQAVRDTAPGNDARKPEICLRRFAEDGPRERSEWGFVAEVTHVEVRRTIAPDASAGHPSGRWTRQPMRGRSRDSNPGLATSVGRSVRNYAVSIPQ